MTDLTQKLKALLDELLKDFKGDSGSTPILRALQRSFWTESAEWPDCSGTFDMVTGIYADILHVGDQVFRTEFALRDGTLLIFELLSAEEVLP